MLQGGYASVLQSRSRDDFRDEVVRFTQQMGFSTVSAMVVIDHTVRTSDFLVVDNTPD